MLEPIVKRLARVMVLTAYALALCMGCGGLYTIPPTSGTNVEASSPVTVGCEPYTKSGIPYLKFSVTNGGHEKIYLTTTDFSPYLRIESDGTLVVFSCLLPPIRQRAGTPSIMEMWESRVIRPGRKVEYRVQLVPFEEHDWWNIEPITNFVGGKVKVVCKAGWRWSPLPANWAKTSLEDLDELRNVASSDPVYVVFP